MTSLLYPTEGPYLEGPLRSPERRQDFQGFLCLGTSGGAFASAKTIFLVLGGPMAPGGQPEALAFGLGEAFTPFKAALSF